MSGEGEPGFLGRWSRRKRGMEAEAETPPDALAMPEVPPAEPDADSPGGMPKSGTCPIPGMEPIDLSTLPRIDELSVTAPGAFLRPGIPAALRSAALRRMWSRTPRSGLYRPRRYRGTSHAGGCERLRLRTVGDVQNCWPSDRGVEEKPPPHWTPAG